MLEKIKQLGGTKVLDRKDMSKIEGGWVLGNSSFCVAFAAAEASSDHPQDSETFQTLYNEYFSYCVAETMGG